jgi:Arc/MetJ-type ribon-helix-helix transcriptional regulator
VLIPLATWKTLLASWERRSEMLEDQEDRAILQEWLAKRAAGETESLPLDELEQDLRADSLLPG